MERFESASTVEGKNSIAKFEALELLQPFSDKLPKEPKLQSSKHSAESTQTSQISVGEKFDYDKSAGSPKFLDRTSLLSNLDRDRLNYADSVPTVKPIQAGMGEDLALLATIGGGFAIMAGKANVGKIVTKTIMTGGELAIRNPRTAIAIGIGAYLYNQFGPSDTKSR